MEAAKTNGEGLMLSRVQEVGGAYESFPLCPAVVQWLANLNRCRSSREKRRNAFRLLCGRGLIRGRMYCQSLNDCIWGAWTSGGPMLDFGATKCPHDTRRRRARGDMQRSRKCGKEHDPLASHIFVSRRNCGRTNDTKSGKRHHAAARLSWQKACELGFRGTLGEWERLMDATPRR